MPACRLRSFIRLSFSRRYASRDVSVANSRSSSAIEWSCSWLPAPAIKSRSIRVLSFARSNVICCLSCFRLCAWCTRAGSSELPVLRLMYSTWVRICSICASRAATWGCA